MQQAYAERVADNGRSDLLVQRAIRDIGHCSFATSEWETAFADLVDWVETGNRPAGDDIFALGVVFYELLTGEFGRGGGGDDDIPF